MTRIRSLAGLLGAGALVLSLATGAPASPAAAATSSCTVAYSVVNSWPGGFQGGITITNNAAPITSWTLAFTFPGAQQVGGGWGGTFTQAGQYVSVTSESWDGALATGGSTTIGFTGTVGATNAVPSYFTVNGYACNGAAQVPSVNITSPAAGASVTPGTTVPVTANASEPTASISKVEFFATSTLPGTPATPVLIGTATASPYTVSWTSAPAGYYVTDRGGVRQLRRRCYLRAGGAQRGARDQHRAAVARVRQRAGQRQRPAGGAARRRPVRH